MVDCTIGSIAVTDYAEKADKLLARQLKQKDASITKRAIKDKNGDVFTSVKEMNEVFMDFYTRLYKSETDPSSRLSKWRMVYRTGSKKCYFITQSRLIMGTGCNTSRIL